MAETSPTSEPPCVGLDPDTDPCPICGAPLCEPCRRAPPAQFADVVAAHITRDADDPPAPGHPP